MQHRPPGGWLQDTENVAAGRRYGAALQILPT